MTEPRPATGAALASRPIVLLLAAAASWGLGTVASRRAVVEIPPLTLLLVQLAASAAVLAITLVISGADLGSWRRSPGLVALGLLNPGLGYGLGLLGLATISASLYVILWAAEPLMITLVAALALREAASTRFIVLSAAAALGVVAVLYDPGAAGEAIGVLLTLAGVACCALYTVISRRWLGHDQAPAPIVLGQQVVALLGAGVVVAIAGFAAGASDVIPSMGAVSLTAWISAIGSGILYYAVAYVAYLSALRKLPASTASSSFYLIPIFGVAGAAVLLGERLTSLQWLGAAVALGAVFLLLRPALPRLQPASFASERG